MSLDGLGYQIFVSLLLTMPILIQSLDSIEEVKKREGLKCRFV